MHKLTLLILIFVFSGCTMPIFVETEHLSVFKKDHIPNTDGVLDVQVKGYSYYHLWVPKESTTRPKTKLSPITQEPIFDFFSDGEGIEGAIRKLKKRPASSSGSCFIVAKQNDYYYAVTARHVIMIADAIILIDQQKGEIVTVLNRADIAILKFKSNKIYPIYKSSLNAKVLDDAWLVGYPGDVIGTIRKFTVKGNVCNVSKIEIWFSGGGAKGMSGGPMLNNKDEVIGVISRFIPSIPTCDNFVNSVPARFFKYELELILSKERIKNITNRINILKKKNLKDQIEILKKNKY